MTESKINIMAQLLAACLPYLTSAKTYSELPSRLTGDNAGILQKSINNILDSHNKSKAAECEAAINRAMERFK